MAYTQNDNLLIQSRLIVDLLISLHKNDFLNSKYYKSDDFEFNYKNMLSDVGLDNQGSLLIFLYVMLVLPKQILDKDFSDVFQQLNCVVDQIKSEAHSTYPEDSEKIDYIRHIRNSVAHARVTFVPKETVMFTDINGKEDECNITIPLKRVGDFLNALQVVYELYVQNRVVKVARH